MHRMAAIALLAGCHAYPPPPFVAFHRDTAADAPGETQLTVVVGGAVNLGGKGVGVALRVAHQETERTSLAGELAVAQTHGITAVQLRGYAVFTPRGEDSFAVLYGGGLEVTSTRMTALMGHAGIVVGAHNDTVVPYLGAGLAIAIPVIRGRAFGDDHVPPPTTGFAYLDLGLTSPEQDDHRLSLDVGTMLPFGRDGKSFAASLGYTAP